MIDYSSFTIPDLTEPLQLAMMEFSRDDAVELMTRCNRMRGASTFFDALQAIAVDRIQLEQGRTTPPRLVVLPLCDGELMDIVLWSASLPLVYHSISHIIQECAIDYREQLATLWSTDPI